MTVTSSTPRTSHLIGREFITAGLATFTLVGRDTRFTYKVTRKEPEAGSRYGATYFVALLTGSNNESDYSYLGILDAATGTVKLTKGSKMTPDAPAVKAISWALPLIWRKATMPASFAIMHEGRCGRCGRPLTVPESIDRGIGPDCAGKMGLAFGPAQPAARPSLTDLAAQAASLGNGSSLFEGPAFQ